MKLVINGGWWIMIIGFYQQMIQLYYDNDGTIVLTRNWKLVVNILIVTNKL